jgi:LacI family transcriptional regulator
MTTIREVANRAQVSQSTVSHVINQTRFVSEDVKQRVFAAMQALNYQPNALARSLRSGRTNTIGLILPDSANPFFAEIGRKVEAAAYDRGFSVILCNTEGMPEKERFYLDVLNKKRVDGIILVSVGAPGGALQDLQRQNIPIVAVDRDFENDCLDVVLSDNRLGGLVAVRHLVRLGHRRIACITGPSGINPSAARATGYAAALDEAGLPLDQTLIRLGDFHPESGWKAAAALLRLPDRPSAIFSCNDLMAMGVLRAAAELNLRVPADLAVVGYDDIELAAYTTPALTTVAQRTAEIAQNAITRLVEKVASGDCENTRIILEPQLVVRRSCGANQ